LEIKGSICQIKKPVESFTNRLVQVEERISRLKTKFLNYYIQIVIKKNEKYEYTTQDVWDMIKGQSLWIFRKGHQGTEQKHRKAI
jgi:hypothetical protein